MSFVSERLYICGTAMHSVMNVRTGVAQEITTNPVAVLLSGPNSGKRYLILRYIEDGAFNIREINLDWQTEIDKPDLIFVWADKIDSQSSHYHTLKFQKKVGFETFVKWYSHIEKGARGEGTGGLELSMEKIIACIGLMNRAEVLVLVKVVLCLALAQVWHWVREKGATIIAWFLTL